MAHQAHNIPWTTLSASLSASKHGPRGTPDRITVLSPTRTPAAEKQRRHFVRVFVRHLAAFAASERAKYPADPLETNSAAAPTDGDGDDGDDPANPRILTPAVEAALSAHLASPHSHATLNDLLSRARKERRAQGWTGQDSYGDDRAELVMALVATDELLPLLRLARWRAPGAGSTGVAGEKADRSELMGLWKYPGANPGWSNVLTAALEAYVFFNVVYVREELWAQREEGRDYRDDGAFARMMADCTSVQDGCTWGIPHRAFHGGECYWSVRTHEEREQMKARWDPMRVENLGEMKKYLSMCWEHLVRVYVVLNEAGEDYDWEAEVEFAIDRLWDMRKP